MWLLTCFEFGDRERLDGEDRGGRKREEGRGEKRREGGWFGGNGG